jgi:flagellar hook-associated protein 1 FlgK
MTLSVTLATALSGLSVATRGAEVISSNIANAQTEGYARRELEVTSRVVGSASQGVQVASVRRIQDERVLADRRLSQAGSGAADTRAGFLARLEEALGQPQADGSLTARIAAFDSALIAAASRPDSEPRLAAVLDGARGLVRGLADASQRVQTARMRADADIARQVGTVNDALGRVADLNDRIVRAIAAGRDTTALLDQRQQAIDAIAPILPLREITAADGRVALYTAGGTALLDGSRPNVLGFTATPTIVPQMTLASGALSGLTVGGRAVATGPGGPLSGGTLAAGFEVRDAIAPEAQSKLDALARDLVTRFSDPSADGTLPPGAPGLFTDGGAAFEAANETGLAGRLSLNAAADPAAGGGLWRLRDGLGAAMPGPAGDGQRLSALRTALVGPRVPASGGFGPGALGFAELASNWGAEVSGARLSAETDASFARARAEALREAEGANGVDTDREIQGLLAVERAYAANARVLQTVDEMIARLLEI